MKKLFFSYSLFLIGIFALLSFSNSKQATSSIESNDCQLFKDSNKLYFLVKESFDLKGNGQIYLDKNWKDGTITDLNDYSYKIQLRYRIAKEEMQVKHNGKTKALQLQQIKKVTFGGDVFISSEFLLKEEKFMSFFEVIEDGNLKLLLQHESKEKGGHYTSSTSYYSKIEGSPAEKLQSKKKCILNLMKDKKSLVNTFIKKNNINLKNGNDLKKLFKFYNSL